MIKNTLISSSRISFVIFLFNLDAMTYCLRYYRTPDQELEWSFSCKKGFTPFFISNVTVARNECLSLTSGNQHTQWCFSSSQLKIKKCQGNVCTLAVKPYRSSSPRICNNTLLVNYKCIPHTGKWSFKQGQVHLQSDKINLFFIRQLCVYILWNMKFVHREHWRHTARTAHIPTSPVSGPGKEVPGYNSCILGGGGGSTPLATGSVLGGTPEQDWGYSSPQVGPGTWLGIGLGCIWGVPSGYRFRIGRYPSLAQDWTRGTPLPQGWTGDWTSGYPLPLSGHTDACDNITFLYPACTGGNHSFKVVLWNLGNERQPWTHVVGNPKKNKHTIMAPQMKHFDFALIALKTWTFNFSLLVKTLLCLFLFFKFIPSCQFQWSVNREGYRFQYFY